jgi:hypothetical protein
MLGRNGQYLDPRWSLDPHNREVVLAALAKLFVKGRKGAVSHHDAVAFIEQIFADLDWPDSAVDTLESFRAMKILRIDNEVVQFQQTSFLHLFAAKAAISDEKFLLEILHDPLYFAPIVRHYAALVRSGTNVVASMAQMLSTWHIADPSSPVYGDMQEAEAPADRPDIQEDETDTSDDQIEDDEDAKDISDYDDSDDADAVPFPLTDPTTWSRTNRLAWTLDLTSRVVRDSDQITDRDLKESVLSEVLVGWGYLLELFVADAVFVDPAHSIAQQMVDAGDLKEARKEEMGERLSLLLPAFAVMGGIASCLSSRKLLRAFQRVAEDGTFVDSPYGRAMAPLFSYQLQETGWAKPFLAAASTGSREWIVVEFLHLVARISFERQALSPQDEDDLLEFLKLSGSNRFAFAGDAERRRWVASFEQRVIRKRKLLKRERLPRGARALEA